MLEIRTTSFDFAPTRGYGPQTAEEDLVFPRDVATAVVGITGYSVDFVGKDHHLGRMVVGVESQVVGRTVRVAARSGLRDWSGNWDDEYGGSVTAVVLAGLVFLEPPLPSGKGAIIGEQEARSATGAEAAVHLPPHPDWDRFEVVHGSVHFAPLSGSGPRSAASDVAFAQPVNLVAGLLTGWMCGSQRATATTTSPIWRSG